MRIFLSIKYHHDQSNRALIESLCAALEAGGHSAVCIIRDVEHWGNKSFSPEELMRLTFEQIRACDEVIIDLSEKGVGVGIEAGYAHACAKPVWVIARQGSDISETLRGIARQVYFYQDPEDVRQIFSAPGIA